MEDYDEDDIVEVELPNGGTALVRARQLDGGGATKTGLGRLDLASVMVAAALDTPYLVGSCLERPDFRDVDIRVILDDKRFKQLFGDEGRDPLRHLVQVAISEHYVKATGLRIDFQIQQRTSANARYPGGARHPLGMYLGRRSR